MNTVTSVNSVITAVQTVALAIDSVTNLTGFDDSGLDGLGGEIDELSAIVAESQIILFNLRSLEQQATILFGLDDAPDNTRALQERLFAIRRYYWEQQMQARRIQTLMYTATDTLRRIIRLWDRILDVLGAKQSSQVIQSQLTQMQYLTQKHSVIQAAYNQAHLATLQEPVMVDESISRINGLLILDWPAR